MEIQIESNNANSVSIDQIALSKKYPMHDINIAVSGKAGKQNKNVCSNMSNNRF